MLKISSQVFGLLLVLILTTVFIGSSTNPVQGLKDGECPFKLKSSCKNVSIENSCNQDEDCSGFDKCCYDGCSLVCIESIVSGCQQSRRQARLLNTVEPSCDQNGNFEAVQCKGDVCWCVDVFGLEIGGTRVIGSREAVDCTKFNPICSAHQCRMLCPYGFDVDENGCSVCTCRDICKEINCPTSSRCEVIEIPCKDEPCPPQPVCREGRGLDSLCPFGKPLIIPENGNPYLCGNGVGKPSCPPAFGCNIEDGNDYGVCCSRTLNLEKAGECPVITTVGSSSFEDSSNCTTCKLDVECPDTEKCCPSANCGKSCLKPANLTLCIQQRQISQLLTTTEEPNKGYVPQCDENGHFLPKQCSKNGKICWCVDPEGKASVTGIGAAESVNCNPSSKSITAQPRGLRRTNSIEAFSVNPCHVGTPLLNYQNEVQICGDQKNSGCPESYSCIMAQVNSVGVCCLNQTVTEPTKPGMCPFLSSVSLCHNNESKSCQSDKECEGDMKCCSLGGSSCFGRAICADPLLVNSAEEIMTNSFSICRYLNNVGKKSNGVLKKYKMAFGVPNCKQNGEFEPVQCNDGNCWCVDEFGMTVGDIVSNNATELKCKEMEQIPCLGMTCKLNCQYGYLKNPVDGCNICECRNPCNDNSLCGSESICEMVDVDCPETMVCPPLPYCLPKSLIVPTCPANSQPYIDPVLNEKMTCNPRARMLQCPDDHYCHEVDDDLGLCCPVLEDVVDQQLTANLRAFSFNNNNDIDDQLAEDNHMDDTIVEIIDADFLNPLECPEEPIVNGECGFKCLNNTDCTGGDNIKCCANECGTNCIDVTQTFSRSHCLMKKEVGHCKAALPKWFFNVESNTCEEYLYSGCGGNPNRFSTKEKCEHFCRDLSSCERSKELKKREKSSNSHKIVHIPECSEDNGEWKPLQCLNEVGLCWCVDSVGEIIKGTIGNKGSVICTSNMKKNNRKSRLLSTQVTRVCPENQSTHICDPSLCLNKICLADPTAICRVNPCNGCTVEFYNIQSGQMVNCTRNLTACELELQTVFNSRAFEIQRQLASKELETIEFLGNMFSNDPDEALPDQQREKRLRRDISSDGSDSCPQQPIQYLLNLLSGSCNDECTLDSDCPGSNKCCLAECGLKCLAPVTTATPVIVSEPPSPIMMLLIPPQCKKENGEYEQVQAQNGVEYCVDEITGEPHQLTFTRGTVTNCTDVEYQVPIEERVCLDPNVQPMVCRHECLNAKCLAHSEAICVADPCNSCSVSFHNLSGEKLNCEHKCTQKLEIGHCRASIRRYYFNQQSAKCEEFIYGGCQGNDNNFGTLAECEMECGIATRDICTDIPRVEEHTRPCKDNEARYFYNSETRKCEESSNCLLGNFVSKEQCESSCPRHVICPIIQDDVAQIQICDRHEACDNVTYCIMELENIICNVDPCNCRATLTDLLGNPIDSCSSDLLFVNLQPLVESKEQGEVGDIVSSDQDSSSQEAVTLDTPKLVTKENETWTLPVKSDELDDNLKFEQFETNETLSNDSQTRFIDQVLVNNNETRSLPAKDLEEDFTTENPELSTIPEVIETTEKNMNLEQEEPLIRHLHPKINVLTENESEITSMATPDLFKEQTTIPSISVLEEETTPIYAKSMNVFMDEINAESPLETTTQQNNGEKETTTTISKVEQPRQEDGTDSKEETTTNFYSSTNTHQDYQPSRAASAEDSSYPPIAKGSSEQEIFEKEIDEEIITESVEGAAIEFQTLFFTCFTILSALLILIGVFFAKRTSKRVTSTQSANNIKKFEPLEFNSFVQLQQQIEYTKQQHQQQENNTSNLKKFDSTLTIPSDSYYDQLYQ